MIKLLLIFAFVSITIVGYSQFPGTDSNWFFSDYSGLTWTQLQPNQNPVFVMNGEIANDDHSAVISDELGNLLFYTNGKTVWANDHSIWANSTPASFGGDLNGDGSSTQCGLIIPRPFSNSEYYIFTIDNNYGPHGLCYSKADMNLNVGLGDIDLAEKNIQLITPVCEKISYSPHSNGTDIWVIAHKWNSNEFYSYLVSATGVDYMNPVISNIGTIATGMSSNTRGHMKVSPQGDKLALAIEGSEIFELYDFDNTTGIISNHIVLSYSNMDKSYGVEFSFDGNYLYGSERWGYDLFQWDVSLSGSIAINSSINIIATLPTSYGGALQRGPDQKIYLARNNTNYLGCINNPQLSGVSCNYVDEQVLLGPNLTTANLSTECLPVIYKSYIINNYNPPVVSDPCFNDTTFFNIPPNLVIDSAYWNFNYPSIDPQFNIVGTDMEETFIYSEGGVYMVQLILFFNGVPDTSYIDALISSAPVIDFGPDTNLCQGETLIFDFMFNNTQVVDGQCDYYWQSITDTGSSSNTYGINMISYPGQYIMEIVGDTLCGSTYDEILVSYSDLDIDFWPDTIFIQPNTTYVLDQEWVGMTYLWSTGEITPTIEIVDEGIYSVTITDEYGCLGTGEVYVTFYTSIEGEILNSDYNLYPNPASEYLYIEKNNLQEVYCEIYNSLGLIMVQIKLLGPNSHIDISDFKEGTYFLKVISNQNNCEVLPFLIMR